jgi:hypothetical protein
VIDARLTALGVALFALTAAAEPHLAVREGFLCSQCHVNRAGGGKRNAFGANYSQTALPLWRPAALGVVSPNLGDWVSLGADVRVQHVTIETVRTKFEGEWLEAQGGNTLRVPQANLYGELTIVRDHLSLYLDEKIGPEGASAREAMVLLYGLPYGGYAKAGRILLPFGLRLADDEAFIRQATGFNFGNQDLGVEVGAEPGPTFLTASLSNGTLGGTDDNERKQLCVTGGVRSRWGRLGGSYSWNDGTTPDGMVVRQVAGGFGTLNFGRLSLLSEGDVVIDTERPKGAPRTQVLQLAVHGEADLLITKGVAVRAAFGYHDPDLAVKNDHRTRLAVTLEVFPLPFLRVTATYTLRNDIPQRVQGRQDIFLVQLHGFL